MNIFRFVALINKIELTNNGLCCLAAYAPHEIRFQIGTFVMRGGITSRASALIDV
jgi:hypothetical protein